MECTTCHRPLTNGVDTFGPIEAPLCLECHFERLAEIEADEAQAKKEAKIMFNLMAGIYDGPEWFGLMK